eukprot:gene12626-9037_t
MSDADDLFGSDDEDVSSVDDLAERVHVAAQQVLTKLLSHDMKPKVRSVAPSYWDKVEADGKMLGKRLLLLHSGDAASSMVGVLETKLATAGFDSIALAPFALGEPIEEDYDCIVLVDVPYAADESALWSRRIGELQLRHGRRRVLMPGGLLVSVNTGGDVAIDQLLHPRQWQKIDAATAAGATVALWKKRALLCNETAAIYWTKDLSQRPLENEWALLEQLAVPLTVAERDTGAFSAAHRAQIVAALQRHGVVLVISLRRHDEALDEAASELVTDMQETLQHLQARYDIDLLFPRADQNLENFRELSLREHRRCDLRSTPRLTRLCPPPVRASTVPTASVAQSASRWTWPAIDVTYLQRDAAAAAPQDEHSQRPKAFAVAVPDPSQLRTSVLDELRLHPAMISAIHETLCPRSEASAGNWGRWNFEGPGPEAPQTIAVGQPGVVFSFPGCTDQTIHADTPHLFEVPVSPPLAPHYLNYFLPMPRPVGATPPRDEDCFDSLEPAEGSAGAVLHGQRVGQTAFVLGSHGLDVTKRVMADDDIDELLRRLVRPLYFPGDALVFDCRILHFGLANQLPPMPNEVQRLPTDSDERQQAERQWREGVIRDASRWRPMVYVNCTKDWFQDPKNWNDRRAIYPPST